ncbi:hypothetical protein C8E01_1351 [Pontibacter virosus]|uniref:Uncharacterized protein n=1 Tax=Pontibacter virosus TaxID=1765052 RepID=A0A2U1AGT0_9BACT|nr:hypothetical protein C8E01_1351 [Pontibacter virosus]
MLSLNANEPEIRANVISTAPTIIKFSNILISIGEEIFTVRIL